METVRYDKNWDDCMSLAEMQTLREEGEGKLCNRRFDDDHDNYDDESTVAKRRRRIVNYSKCAAVPSLYKPADVSHVMVETHDLRGKVRFLIMTLAVGNQECFFKSG